jgi:hypothetical protein
MAVCASTVLFILHFFLKMPAVDKSILRGETVKQTKGLSAIAQAKHRKKNKENDDDK